MASSLLLAPPRVATGSTTPPAPGRLAFVDGLRGIAVLMVLTYHAWLHPVGQAIRVPGVGIDLTAPLHFGYLGVHLFLVLSGFCLTYPLARRELTVDLRQFAARRAWRILPPYYVALALFLGLRVATHKGTDAGNVITHLLMVYNLWPQWMGSINGSFWSLALEWQLYLVFPLFLWGFRHGLAKTVATALVLTLAYRTWAFATHDLSNLDAGYYWCYALPGRVFEFVLGMTAAVLLVRAEALRTSVWQRRFLAATVASAGLGLAVTAWWHPFAPVVDPVWGVAFFSLLMLVGVRNATGTPWLTWRPLVWLGTISYSVYLIHAPLLKQLIPIVRGRGFSPTVTWLLFEFAVVPALIVLGWIFYRLVEARFIAVGKARTAAANDRPPAMTLVVPVVDESLPGQSGYAREQELVLS